MRQWSIRKVLLLIVAANLMLGVFLLGLRPPTRVPADAAPRPELPQQFRQVQAQINEGRHGESFSMVLSDGDLTAAVGYFSYSSRDVPFTRIQVRVKEGGIVIDAVTKGTALTLPVRVAGTVGARGGLPWAQVVDVSLGDTGVPAFVRDQVVRQANASLDFSRYDLAVTVEAIEMRPGTMTVRGTVK